VPIIPEKYHCVGGEGGEGMMQPHHVQLMSAVASAVIQSITVEGKIYLDIHLEKT